MSHQRAADARGSVQRISIPTIFIIALSAWGAQGVANAQSNQLEEITVTARRVTESLQSTPLSVTAMTSDFIVAQRIQETNQIIEWTPGATFTSFNKGQYDFSIRGISSQGEGAAADSAVLTVVDNVVLVKDILKSLEFYDLQQVEVLRGPQGTTFGRNASAGAVHIINALPSRDADSWVEGTLGNYNLVEINGALNGPIGETAAGRLSFHYDKRDGYTEDRVSGNNIDDVRNLSVRGQLLFSPSDTVEVLLKAEYSEDDDGYFPRKAGDCTQPYVSPPFGNFQDSCDPWSTEVSQESSVGPFQFKRKIRTAAATVDWDISDSVALTSITAYVDADVNNRQDNFGSPHPLVFNLNSDDANQFTQEFRLGNAASGDRLTWLAGLFYLKDDHTRIDNRELVTHLPFATFQGATTSNKTESIGLFGQVDYELSDRARITVGGRYSRDEKDFNVFHDATGALSDIFLDPAEAPISASPSNSWSNFSGSLSLSYDVSDSVMAYGLVSSGYKSGGFNGEPYTLEAALTPYDEETVVSFELGAKMDLLDDRLRLNLSLFNLDYKDLQVAGVLPSGTPIIENAAGGTDVTGVEAEFTWLVTDNFSLFGSASKIDAKLKGEIDGESVEGNAPDNSPDWTATLGGSYDISLSNGSTIQLRGDYRGRSLVYLGFDGDPKRARPSFDSFGAAINWISQGEVWRISLWSRNLRNDAEVTSVGPTAIVDQAGFGYGPPRTVGLTARYNFQ